MSCQGETNEAWRCLLRAFSPLDTSSNCGHHAAMLPPYANGLPAKSRILSSGLGCHWFVALAAAVWIAPVVVILATQVWTTEQGALGPIILCTGIWLFVVEQSDHADARAPGDLRLAVSLLAACVALQIVARMIGMLALEIFSVWAGSVALLYAYYGQRFLRGMWLPLTYLLFLVPPPFFVVAPTIQMLKLWISDRAVVIVSALGFDAASNGSSLYIDQYELLIDTACAGMNSLLSLLALSLFYVHVCHRGDWHRAIVLMLAAAPLAIGMNLLRVVVLLLLVHRFGAPVLATPVHMLAGLGMAAVAMLALASIDRLGEWRLRFPGIAGAA